MSEDTVPVRRNIKKGLGRGLGSLLGAQAEQEHEEFERVEIHGPRPQSLNTSAPAPSVPEESRVWLVGVERVIPNREQPRKHFDAEKLNELAASIKEKGVLLPILVRKIDGDKLEIIAGERRWRASQLAGLKEVPVLIRQAEKRESLELALIENIQRADLNPIDEAEAYQLLSQTYSLTQQQIADRVGKERATIANVMRLIGLHPEVRALVKSGELQLGQAKILLAVTDSEKQKEYAKKVVREKLTVRGTEKLIQATQNSTGDLDLEPAPYELYEIKPLVSELQKYFGTKVEIDLSGKRSRIAINFYSVEELNQFMDKVRKAWPQ